MPEPKTRVRDLIRLHGLTPARLKYIRTSQGNRCAICDDELGTGKQVHVDHCHRTNRVRGILCAKCNTGLGKLGDDIEGLRRALAYLERFEARFVNLAKKNRYKERKAAGLVGPAGTRAKKTHCKRGHEMTDENTGMEAGKRRCRACVRLRMRATRASIAPRASRSPKPGQLRMSFK
jgi:hypothetical protein